MALTPQLRQERLFRQQQMMNRGLQGVSGAMAIAGQGIGMINEAKQINTVAPTPTMDSFGKPIFNLGDFTSQVSAIKPQGATFGEAANSTLQGAMSGFQVGGPLGAGIGAAIGLGSSLIFGRRRKTLQERKKTLAQGNLFQAQRLFNQGMEVYNARQSAQSLYNEQQQAVQNRLGNVYQALS